MDPRPPIRIAPSLLDERTLRNVIEEFVTRDGTEFSLLETKIGEVRLLLARGEVELWFDPESSTCNILRA
jgi:uncharacterized protein